MKLRVVNILYYASPMFVVAKFTIIILIIYIVVIVVPSFSINVNIFNGFLVCVCVCVCVCAVRCMCTTSKDSLFALDILLFTSYPIRNTHFVFCKRIVSSSV